MDRAILEEELERRWNLEEQAKFDAHRRLMRQARAAARWRKWSDARDLLVVAGIFALALMGMGLVIWGHQ